MNGGPVLAGEINRKGACRELREEVGLRCSPEALVYIGTVVKGRAIVDLYRCDQEFDAAKLSLQPEEVVAARKVTRGMFLDMIAQGEVVPHVGLQFQLFAEKILDPKTSN